MKEREKKNKRRLIRIKQLEHNIQNCKAQLAQRDHDLNTLRLEHANKCESLQEKCNQLAYENKLLQAQLNNIVAVCTRMPVNG
jgi:chromosome segregation ATPase